MNCNCNTYNDFKVQFLDLNGLTYLLSLLNTVTERKIDNKIALIPKPSTTIAETDLATNEDIDNIFA